MVPQRYISPSILAWAVAVVSIPIVCPSTCAQSSEADRAVERAVPYLQSEGESWIKRRGCVSCHQIPFMLWSLSEAASQGFDVDEERLAEQWRWSTDVTNFVKPEQKSDVDVSETLAANIDTMNALLLATGDTQDEKWRTQFASALVENQKPDGSWQACGQLPAQKRPSDETTRVTVAWSLLALVRHEREPRDLESAINLIDEEDDAKSTEWWVARMLLARELEQPATRYRKGLIARQNVDGGWGWLSEDASDAMATGMAMYGLLIAEPGDQNGRAITRAIDFLTTSQNPDGSWDVPGTKKSSRNRPTPTSNYWGTAWAVIGLLAARS